MTTGPFEHGGLATQQADAIAQAIGATLGGPAVPPARPALPIRLAGGDSPLCLRIELDASGRRAATEVVEPAPDAPLSAKIHATYLTRYLEDRARWWWPWGGARAGGLKAAGGPGVAPRTPG
jgi:hypothetical protein